MSVRPWLDADLVLDTNILIHLARFDTTGSLLHETYFRPRYKAGWIAPIVSVVSVAEAMAFADQNSWGLEKRERLRKLLERCVCRDVSYDDRSLLDAYVVTLDRVARNAGNRLAKNDLWIASEARRMGVVLLICDADFDLLGTAGEILLDRFSPAPSA